MPGPRRRDLIIAGGVVAAVVALPPILRGRSVPELEPLAGLPGWRRLAGSVVAPTGAGLALAGLDGPSPELLPLIAAFRADPEAALGFVPGKVPMRLFTDRYCPNCPAMEARVSDLEASEAGTDLSFVDLPLLGPASDRAARLAVAGRSLGAEAAIRAALKRVPTRPGPEGVRRIAEAAGLSPEALARAEASPETDLTIRRNRAAAWSLGIVGTPGLVIGRTVALGTVDARLLARLVGLERERLAGHQPSMQASASSAVST